MKSIAKAVITLTSFSVAERVLGFLFKIYLSREIGAVGLGVYSVALSFFFVLLTLITSGIPLIVSKSTATDKAVSSAVCSAAILIELAVSLCVCLAVILFKNRIATLFADEQSIELVLIMLPSLIFSGLYSAFRGVLWGEKRFISVSLVELIEQITRILACVTLFILIKDKNTAVALSMTIGCGVSALSCAVCYFATGHRLRSPKGQLKPLFKQSTPITLSRTTSSVNNYVIAITVPFLLMSSGLNTDQSMYVYGSCVGMALPLLYLPITIVGSLAFAMIPTLSHAYSNNDKKSACMQIENALCFSIIIAAIVLPVYTALGDDIGTLIYDNSDAGVFLQKSAWLLLPLSFENIASSMLNSLDLERKSLINYIVGAVITYAICFCFYSNFTIDVFIIAFGISLIVSSILDIIDIKRVTGCKLTFIRPLVVCLFTFYPAQVFTEYVNGIISNWFVGMAVSAIGGICFMSLLLVVFGAIDFSFVINKKSKTKINDNTNKKERRKHRTKRSALKTR